MDKRKLFLGIGFAIIIIAIFSYLFLFKKQNTAKPQVGPIVEAIYALGTVKSDDIYNLKLGITSGLTKLYVTEGDLVEKGQKLIATESSDFTSPIAGTVTRIYLDKGETIMPGISVLTVMDLNKTFVQVSLDQSSALRIRKDQKAELSFENLRGSKLIGKVKKVYPSDGQFIVRLETDSLPEGILPGMTADVAIEVAKRDNVLLIPANAIHRGQVRIKRKGKVEVVSVKIGAVNGELAEILEGGIFADDEIFLGRE
ncbi:MAG TPA: HlyD family efflux transporter periplasmic adaptor subunit [Leptospiraceae bacterium]|nr:HlyD family efflux transporter periplasmic adaptor subunit [Leptospiraceae bacterium]HMX33955.1 HlyD family efflux transporter periplasmic adaptor subunit [Leptospiraceae bacterium]HMY30873.1 HlyD family efflux transporter periplasmic adaptor subunit [Leptospiraceae bacterium]HMZ62677.1 HlyD family efflux transporter periplasmic adaptor subunit [Leptospiraceae bacterium]HNA08719.1 HlyD family efflux transporter periplasmic adaptor subunit [Leptospiraceae bacterium]